MPDEEKDTRKDSRFPAWHIRNQEVIEPAEKPVKKPK